MSRLKIGVGAAMVVVAFGLSSCSAVDSVVSAAVEAGFESTPGSQSSNASASTVPDAKKKDDYLQSLKLLEGIDVKGRAPKTGYARDQFSNGWKDFDGDGCDERNGTLKRDLVDIHIKPKTQGCVVLTGTFHDPYSGTTIEFIRGQQTSSAVQIDHVVALSNLWQTGAQQWDVEKRKAVANDPLNLLASDGPTNASKGDGDAATWLPPNKAFRCDYVARQTQVKAKYDAWMTKAEHATIEKILTKCI